MDNPISITVTTIMSTSFILIIRVGIILSTNNTDKKQT